MGKTDIYEILIWISEDTDTCPYITLSSLKHNTILFISIFFYNFKKIVVKYMFTIFMIFRYTVQWY